MSVVLEMALWPGYCPAWYSSCVWVLEEHSELCDTAEELFVASLHFLKHFDPPALPQALS